MTRLILWWNDQVARVLGFANTGRYGSIIRNGRWVSSCLQIPVKVSPEEMQHLYGGYGPVGWKQKCESVECYIKNQHPARNANRQDIDGDLTRFYSNCPPSN